MVAWFTWYRHNKLWHNLKNQVFPPQKIFDAACNLLTEFQTKTPSIHKQPRPDFIEWKSPAPDEFKTNYDEAMFVDTNEAGIGVVVCNGKGEVK